MPIPTLRAAGLIVDPNWASAVGHPCHSLAGHVKLAAVQSTSNTVYDASGLNTLNIYAPITTDGFAAKVLSSEPHNAIKTVITDFTLLVAGFVVRVPSGGSSAPNYHSTNQMFSSVALPNGDTTGVMDQFGTGFSDTGYSRPSEYAAYGDDTGQGGTPPRAIYVAGSPTGVPEALTPIMYVGSWHSDGTFLAGSDRYAVTSGVCWPPGSANSSISTATAQASTEWRMGFYLSSSLGTNFNENRVTFAVVLDAPATSAQLTYLLAHPDEMLIAGASATVSGVTVAPASPSVAGGGTQQFTATVAGTGSPSQSVTWTTSAGTITTGGLLTVPSAGASAQSITVTATSVADSTKSGMAMVTVPAASAGSLTISPTSATVVGGATQQFTPSASATFVSSPTGAVSASGLFTAPASTSSVQTFTLTATATSGGQTATATVTVPATGAATTPSALLDTFPMPIDGYPVRYTNAAAGTVGTFVSAADLVGATVAVLDVVDCLTDTRSVDANSVAITLTNTAAVSVQFAPMGGANLGFLCAVYDSGRYGAAHLSVQVKKADGTILSTLASPVGPKVGLNDLGNIGLEVIDALNSTNAILTAASAAQYSSARIASTLIASGQDFVPSGAYAAGIANAVPSASSISTGVWGASTRSLTTLGTLVTDITARILKTPANPIASDTTGAISLPSTVPTGYGWSGGGSGLTDASVRADVAASLPTDYLTAGEQATLTAAGSGSGALAALRGAAAITIPGTHTTSSSPLVLTHAQYETLMASLAGGDDAATVPVAGGTATETYYLIGQPRLPANVVMVATVTYNAQGAQVNRTDLYTAPPPY